MICIKFLKHNGAGIASKLSRITYNVLMRITAQWARHVARVVLSTLLLAQAIGIAQACLPDANKPAMAFAGSPCKMNGDHQPMSPNACLSQCLQADQSPTAHHPGIPSLSEPTVLIAPRALFDRSSAHLFVRSECFTDSAPPPPIRFCSLLL